MSAPDTIANLASDVNSAANRVIFWAELAMGECPGNSNRYETAKQDRDWAQRLIRKAAELARAESA